MALIFDDDRLDFGQFPHLMPQRVAIAASQLLAAAPTRIWFEGDDLVASLGWNQRPFVPRMAGLAAAIALRLGLVGRRLRVRMLRARRQRRILRRLAESGLQFSHPCRQCSDLSHLRTNNRLRLRRLPSNQFLRNI